jgi:hypothetical protein
VTLYYQKYNGTSRIDLKIPLCLAVNIPWLAIFLPFFPLSLEKSGKNSPKKKERGFWDLTVNTGKGDLRDSSLSKTDFPRKGSIVIFSLLKKEVSRNTYIGIYRQKLTRLL